MNNEIKLQILSVISKLIELEIGDSRKLNNIKNAIQEGRNISEDEITYLKEKYQQLLIINTPNKIASNFASTKDSTTKINFDDINKYLNITNLESGTKTETSKLYYTQLADVKKNSFAVFSNFLSCSLVIAIVMSIVFLLPENSSKYAFYVFGVCLAGILTIIVSTREYKFGFAIRHPIKIIDYFFILGSTTVFVSNILANQILGITFAFSVIISFFLPGWVLLRLLGIVQLHRSAIGLLVLIFCSSIGLTAFIFVLDLQFRSALILSVIYLCVSLLPLLKKGMVGAYGRPRSYSEPDHKHNLSDVLVLAWVTLFFVFVILTLYPQMTYVPGQDIVRHYSWSSQLILTPDIYGTNYPWFHLPLATVDDLSTPPIWLFQSGISFLSIMIVFSFYIMSKTYLSDIDKRAHLLATIFFFAFSGFGWFYFLQHSNQLDTSDPFSLLNDTNEVSYWDISRGNGGWTWLSFRPLTVGLTVFFVLLYLMRFQDLSKHSYIILASILITVLSQVHFPELIIFTALIFILALIRPTVNLRLRETAISMIIGLAASVIVTVLSQKIFSSEYEPFSSMYIPVLIILASSIILLVSYPRRPRISFKINSIFVASILLFVYCAFVLYWFLNTDKIRFPYAETFQIYGVPLEMYPVLLGITGIFAILGSMLILKNHRHHPIFVFVLFFGSTIILGQIITYVNINIIETSYWERRLVSIVFASASVLSSLIILKIVDGKWLIHREDAKKLLTIVFISFLVVAGILSTFLTIEYQIFSQKHSLTDKELNLQRTLDNSDPSSTLLTVTSRSRVVAEYATLGQIIDSQRYQLWSLKSPEIPLDILTSLNSPIILYISDQDNRKIVSSYHDGYIASHLLKVAPIISEVSGGKKFEIPGLSPVSSSSDMVLVLPENQYNFYYAYDILSTGGYNYTTVLLSDINSLGHARIIVTPNEETALKLIDYKKEYSLKFEKLIILNLDGYGPMVKARDISSNDAILESNSSTEWVTKETGNGTISVLASGIITPSNNNIEFSASVDIAKDFLYSDYQVMAYYDVGVPFILRKTYDEFDLFYLNVNPIILKINSGDADSRSVYTSLSKLLDLIDLKSSNYENKNRSKFKFVAQDLFTFRNATLIGDLSLESPSAIIDTNVSPISVNIDGNSMNFSRVSQILPINIDKLIVKSNGAVIKGMAGFYTNASFNASSVRFIGQPSIISLSFMDGSTSILTGREIEIKLNEVVILLRQPKIESNGINQFSEVYGYGELDKRLRATGQDLGVDGHIIFNITYSDDFAFGRAVLFDGKVVRSQPLYQYDEVGRLTNVFALSNLPYLIPLAGIFVFINVLLVYNKRRKNVKSLL